MRETIGKDSDATLYDFFWVQVISYYSIDNGINQKNAILEFVRLTYEQFGPLIGL